MWWVLKDLVLFGFGLFVGWFIWSPFEEEDSGNGDEVLIPDSPTLNHNRSPLFRAAASARPSSGKEPS